VKTSTRAALRAVATGLFAVLLLTACGDGDEPADPATSSGAASGESSQPTESSGSAQPSESSESSEPAEEPPAGGETVAGADLAQRMLDAMTAAQTASFTGETAAEVGASTTQGVVRIEGDSTSTRATTRAQGETIEIVLLPDGAFVNLGDSGDGKPWLRITPDSTDPAAAAIGQLLDTVQAASDPRTTVEVYRQAGDFALVGTEDVDGVEATHYSGAIPPQALLSTFPEQMRAGLEPLLGTEPFPVEIWLDADDRPVRVVQTATIQGVETTSTQSYFAWGEPVEIAAPPADQVQN